MESGLAGKLQCTLRSSCVLETVRDDHDAIQRLLGMTPQRDIERRLDVRGIGLQRRSSFRSQAKIAGELHHFHCGAIASRLPECRSECAVGLRTWHAARAVDEHDNARTRAWIEPGATP